MRWIVSVSEPDGVDVVETLRWGANVATTMQWAGLASDILQGGAHGGCVVTGIDDDDRAALVRALLSQAPPGQQSLAVSGNTYAQGMDYGALMFLVAELADPLSSDPGVILDGFRSQLRGPESGARTILVVDRPGLLDYKSSMALAQLALRRDIVLVISCRETTELGEDLGAIWNADELVDIRIAPMPLDRAMAHIEKRLGGRISRYAASRLWRHSHGSSRGLDALIDECCRTGQLCLLQDAWVLGTEAIATPPAEQGSGRQSLISVEAVDLLSSMASAKYLDVNVVVESGRLEALDELFRMGLARYGARLGVVECTKAGAEHISREPIHQTTPGCTSDLRVLVSRAWAALDNGRAGEALEVLGDVPEFQANGLSENELDLAAAVVEARADAHVEANDAQAAMKLLRSAVGAINFTGAPLGPLVRARMTRLRLGMARIGLRAGDLDPALELADGANDVGAWLSGTTAITTGTRLSLAALLAEAWSREAKVETGRQLSTWVMEQLAAASNAGTMRETITRRDLQQIGASLMTVSALTGDWGVYRHWSVISDRMEAVAPQTAILTSSMEGIIAFNAGDPQYAIDLMTPVLRQLQHEGRTQLTQCSSSLVACCFAEVGRYAEAQAILSGNQTDGTGAGRTWTAEYYSALSVARLHSKPAGAKRLLALSQVAQRAGARFLEARALAMAVAMGYTDGAAQLAVCAKALESPWNTSFAALANGVRDGNIGATVKALESLVIRGFGQFADPAFVDIMPVLSAVQRRQLHRAVGKLNTRLLEILPRAHGRMDLMAMDLQGPCGESLTPRERQVAELVIEGLSNVQISHRTGVSVRTVEGHLYQVYSKLHIKGRRDLARLGAEQSAKVDAR